MMEERIGPGEAAALAASPSVVAEQAADLGASSACEPGAAIVVGGEGNVDDGATAEGGVGGTDGDPSTTVDAVGAMEEDGADPAGALAGLAGARDLTQLSLGAGLSKHEMPVCSGTKSSAASAASLARSISRNRSASLLRQSSSRCRAWANQRSSRSFIGHLIAD